MNANEFSSAKHLENLCSVGFNQAGWWGLYKKNSQLSGRSL